MPVALFALLALVAVARAATLCSQYTTCNNCFFDASNLGCGWCVSTGKCYNGTETGPIGDDAGKCQGLADLGERVWYHHHSQITKQTFGYPVSPSNTDVYLKPNDPVDVPISVTVPLSTDEDLDVVFVQDTSLSMADDIDTFRALVSSMMIELLKISKTTHVALVSFIEKPCYGRGYPPWVEVQNPVTLDWAMKNYGYMLNQPLTGNIALVSAALLKLTPSNNADFPEAAFDAIGQVLSCSNIGWRANSRRVIVVVTDAMYHYRGDGMPRTCQEDYSVTDSPAWDAFKAAAYGYGGSNPAWTPLAPFPAWPMGTCFGTAVDTEYTALDYDYPTETQIASLLVDNDVLPVFAVAHNCEDETQGLSCATVPAPAGLNHELAQWQQFITDYLIDDYGVARGVAFELSAGASNLVTGLIDALEQLRSTVTLIELDDPINAIAPGIAGIRSAATGGDPVYTNVQPGDTVHFIVTLEVGAAISPTELAVRSPGFGVATIDASNVFPCYDCTGASAPNDPSPAVWDLCDVCEGTDQCVGCDGVAWSGAVEDRCGVCEGVDACFTTGCLANQTDACGVCFGNGQSCLGCDGVANSLAFTDLCGVCLGSNACVGCDGVVYNTSEVAEEDIPRDDVCGICGGDNGCVGCDGVPWSGLIYDICGVCGGFAACKCGGEDPLKANWTIDACGTCLPVESPLRDSCVDCAGVAYGTSSYDVCDECGDAGTLDCIDCSGTPFGTATFDNCGVCGGDGSACQAADLNVTEDVTGVYIEEEDPALDSNAKAALIGVAIAVPATLILAALAVAAFFVWKSSQDRNWALPKSLVASLGAGVTLNPLFQEANGGWAENPLAMGNG